jgi:hypothetical protein
MVGCWDVLVGMVMQVNRMFAQLFVLERRVDAAMVAMRPARGEESFQALSQRLGMGFQGSWLT